MRYAVGLEYDGSYYHGWQKQKDSTLLTIQQQLEKAFSQVANHPVDIVCAGRTDRGVHATAQVIHFESDADRTNYSWLCGVNSILPRDLSVSWIKQINDDFHARFSATTRRYHYWIYNNVTRPAILHNKVTWYMQPLDVSLMQQGAEHLLGEHDFSSFRARDCQANTPVRTIHELNISQHGKYIKIDICANAFLYHMVRNIVGVLFAVGEGKKSPEWVAQVIKAQDRRQADVTAPAAGLYLVHIEYPATYAISCPPPVCYNDIDIT